MSLPVCAKRARIKSLQTSIDDLIFIGEKQAAENKKLRIVSASKVSTIASLLRDVPSSE